MGYWRRRVRLPRPRLEVGQHRIVVIHLSCKQGTCVRFTVLALIYSWGQAIEKLKKEVDKCDLVCSNCHAEIHEDLRSKK